jgi:hypothetical protein
MSLESLHALPALIPIPQLDGHIITSSENKRLRGMHNDRTDIVGMSFKRRDLLRGVVVEDAEMEVVGTNHEPVLSGDEAASADRDVGDLEGLDEGLGLVGPDVDMAC